MKVNPGLEAIVHLHGGISRITLPNGESHWAPTEEMAKALLDGNFTLTTILPIGCRVMKMFDLNGKKKYIVVVEREAIKRNVIYSRGDSERNPTVQFPRMAFVISIVEDGEAYTASDYTLALVIKTPILKLNEPIFHFPGGNVYGDERVCWGGPRHWKAPGLWVANQVAQDFYDSPFNTDLSSMKLTELTKGTDFSPSKLETIGKAIEFAAKGRL